MSLALVAIAAARARRSDVLLFLPIGPILAAMLVLLFDDWSDPNGYVAVAIGTIGGLVSTVVGVAYWVFRPGIPRLTPGTRARP